MEAASAIWSAAGDPGTPDFAVTGTGGLPSAYDVTGLATAAIGAAGAAIAEWVEATTGHRPAVTVDRRLASWWFATSLRPVGWTLPPGWDALAGDYPAADGWIRLHTNAPHHRRAALAALGLPPGTDRQAVAAAVARQAADETERAVLAAGGCAATMRSAAAWAAHPQGRAVAAEPVIHQEDGPPAPAIDRPVDPPVDRARPLAGLRVLDLTRVLAGPAATRFLAGYGANVLRLDPPAWVEPALEPEMTVGKRCAPLDARDPAARDRLRTLLAEADILVHGYRPGALDGLGFGAAERRRLNPALIDVSLDAYGWSGPWAGRRGFDSLVQMSAGIADTGMRWAGADRPTPLPVQALDHATGYILAATVGRALARRARTGAGTTARVSLARTAGLLARIDGQPPLAPRTAADDSDGPPEPTAWGPAHRLRPPLTVADAPWRWDRPAGPLRSADPTWTTPP